ncbi:MAG: type II toxin-antitoxin system HicA family toxin [Synergistaceae bacterium]|nr:type II toxin-antitoxin system HicA family toxin [Synergistaceae bacterium]
MSVKRRELIRHLERCGFYLKREGKRHSFYVHEDGRAIAVKRHNIFDRITANILCRDAGIPEIF